MVVANQVSKKFTLEEFLELPETKLVNKNTKTITANTIVETIQGLSRIFSKPSHPCFSIILRIL